MYVREIEGYRITEIAHFILVWNLKIPSRIAHLTGILVRFRESRYRSHRQFEQDACRVFYVIVERSREFVLEQSDIQSDIGRFRGFPGNVRIGKCLLVAAVGRSAAESIGRIERDGRIGGIGSDLLIA